MRRATLDSIDRSKALTELNVRLADYGRRRYLSYSLDFDTRAFLLEEPKDGWSSAAIERHLRNQEKVKSELAMEFGQLSIQRKIKNYIDLGTKPFSVVAYHNEFFDQSRRAFVMGLYYPSLVSACALGERILNHLILELRDSFKDTPEYKRVYRKIRSTIGICP